MAIDKKPRRYKFHAGPGTGEEATPDTSSHWEGRISVSHAGSKARQWETGDKQVVTKIVQMQTNCIFLPTQIFIGFTQKTDYTISHSYDNIAYALDGNRMSKVCAEVFLELLEKKGDEFQDWRGMNGRQREAVKELMVLTHVAEGAVPLMEDVRDIILNFSFRHR